MNVPQDKRISMQNWQEESKFMAIKEVSERYLELRQNALDYTFEQMNLQLENVSRFI